MSDLIAAAVDAIAKKLVKPYDGAAKFVIEGAGCVIIQGADVRPSDEAEPADVTMRATSEVFQDILAGRLNPAMAFMSGKLKLEGDMSAAMRLGEVLA